MPAPDQQGRLSTARKGQAGAPDFVGVGSHVASLLAAAERAASQILHEANDEAEAIRADARGEAKRVRDRAVSALRDAQRQRGDIEKLVHDVRGAADAYAEQRRRDADDGAAKAHDRLRELVSMTRDFADEITRASRDGTDKRRHGRGNGR